MFKPKNLELYKWKMVKAKEEGKKGNFKPTFDYFLSKYVNQRTVLKKSVIKGNFDTISEIGPFFISSIRFCKQCNQGW
jgi:hypothetical protein